MGIDAIQPDYVGKPITVRLGVRLLRFDKGWDFSRKFVFLRGHIRAMLYQ